MLVDIMFQLLTALIEKAEKTKSVGLKCAPQSPLEEAFFCLGFSAHKETKVFQGWWCKIILYIKEQMWNITKMNTKITVSSAYI